MTFVSSSIKFTVTTSCSQKFSAQMRRCKTLSGWRGNARGAQSQVCATQADTGRILNLLILRSESTLSKSITQTHAKGKLGSCLALLGSSLLPLLCFLYFYYIRVELCFICWYSEVIFLILCSATTHGTALGTICKAKDRIRVDQ